MKKSIIIIAVLMLLVNQVIHASRCHSPLTKEEYSQIEYHVGMYARVCANIKNVKTASDLHPDAEKVKRQLGERLLKEIEKRAKLPKPQKTTAQIRQELMQISDLEPITASNTPSTLSSHLKYFDREDKEEQRRIDKLLELEIDKTLDGDNGAKQ
jgi:hypothetical protein